MHACRSTLEDPTKFPAQSPDPPLVIRVPPDVSRLILARLLKAAEREGWEGAYERADENIYLLRRESDATQIRLVDGEIHIDASGQRQPEFARLWQTVQREIVSDIEATSVHNAGP